MNILSGVKIVHFISSLKMGGAELVLYELVARLQQEGMEQSVIFIHDGPYKEKLEQLGIKTYHLKGKYALFDPWFWIRLYRILKQEKPNCVHASLWAANFSGRVICRLLGIPIICALHNNHDQNGFTRNAIDSLTLWLADEIIAVSDGIVRTMQGYRFLPARRVKVIKNGINAIAVQQKSLEQKKSRDMFGLSAEHFVFGSVGRFVPLKNYHFLLNVFAKLHKEYPHVRLVLVGNGPEEDNLRKQVTDLHLEDVVYFIIGQQAYGYYSLFDCFVQSSVKEGISMALLEAMSNKVPCIVTNSEPIHDVIEDEKNGLLIQANNQTALLKAMIRVISDCQFRKLLAHEGLNFMQQKFSFDAMIDRYKKVFFKYQE